MKLIDYIKSNGKGSKAHELEQSSMQDPFLYEALEGYHSVEGNHAEVLERLDKRYAPKKEADMATVQNLVGGMSMPKIAPTPRLRGSALGRVAWSVAALFVFGLLVGGYFIFFSDREKEVVLASNIVSEPAVDERAAPLAAVPPILEITPEIKERSVAQGKQTTKEKLTVEECTQLHYTTEASAQATNEDEKIAYGAVATHAKKEVKPVAKYIRDQRGAALIMPDSTDDKQPKSSYITASALLKATDVSLFEEYAKQHISKEITAKGCVVLSFKISAKGKPKDIKIVTSLSARADADAIKLVKGWQEWDAENADIRTVTICY